MATAAQTTLMTNTTAPQRRQLIRPAKLQPNIRCLGVLWSEWAHGINGARAAKDFTPEERGAKEIASTFCKRKPVWLLMSKLVNSGLLVPEVIKRLTHVYGPNTSVLQLGKKIKADIDAKRLHHSLTF